jgi:hypothetical protein
MRRKKVFFCHIPLHGGLPFLSARAKRVYHGRCPRVSLPLGKEGTAIWEALSFLSSEIQVVVVPKSWPGSFHAWESSHYLGQCPSGLCLKRDLASWPPWRNGGGWVALLEMSRQRALNWKLQTTDIFFLSQL